jgi:hypothetical protein
VLFNVLSPEFITGLHNNGLCVLVLPPLFAKTSKFALNPFISVETKGNVPSSERISL